ncbi:MAG: hypothetical protein ACFFKA_10280 [Candidatus Thorarchaeota archaeon]
MVVKGKLIAGPAIGIIGGLIVLIASFLAFTVQAALEQELALIPLTWTDIGFDPNFLTIRAVITLILALIGLIGAIMGFLGKKLGAWLMLIAGIVAVVGLFVPLATINLGVYGSILVPLTYSMFYADPFLLLLGGILGLAIK